jgi:hypothetical protein
MWPLAVASRNEALHAFRLHQPDSLGVSVVSGYRVVESREGSELTVAEPDRDGRTPPRTGRQPYRARYGLATLNEESSGTQAGSLGSKPRPSVVATEYPKSRVDA